jgi:hypothetical protein
MAVSEYEGFFQCGNFENHGPHEHDMMVFGRDGMGFDAVIETVWCFGRAHDLPAYRDLGP